MYVLLSRKPGFTSNCCSSYVYFNIVARIYYFSVDSVYFLQRQSQHRRNCGGLCFGDSGHCCPGRVLQEEGEQQHEGGGDPE